MAKKKKHWSHNPIAAGLISAVIGGLILAFVQGRVLWSVVSFVPVVVASAIARSFKWTWMILSSSHLIPGWILVIVGIFAFASIVRFIGSLFVKKTYRQYVEDSIDGVTWRWSWTRSSPARPNNITGFCPSCDASLVCVHFGDSFESRGVEFICERCMPDPNYISRSRDWQIHRVVLTRNKGDCRDARASISREITRRIRTGEYIGGVKPDVNLK